MATADHPQPKIPLAVLPSAVPPAVIRSRPPHPSIPQTKPERDRLLDAIRVNLRNQPVVPPLAMEPLRARATEALAAAGLPDAYLDYAAVLVNNESWRDALSEVPFNRRLLLMPKCLREENRCPAPFDEFGLLCKQCGLCSIQDFQTEAERLGYAVLVAEGSALVMAMIQTGQIEAIVGVSCLPVLGKTFPYVEAAAIPAVAVPLLQDDCIDTTVDIDWVWDYIHLESADQSRRLDLGGLQERVAEWLTPAGLDAELGEAVGPAEKTGRDWLAIGGKRWRPFLAVAVCEALGGDSQAQCLKRLAIAVECFHKASLVHDDIEDGDLERYGQPTLCGREGIPVALNVGDLLIGEGYRLVADSGLSASELPTAVREASNAQRLLCRGQGIELTWARQPELLSSRQVLEIFRLKTAPAFDAAVQFGALAAGRHAEVTDVLHRYSEAVGIAYQIRDDLEDLRDDAGLTHGSSVRPSVVLALAAERARGENRSMLQAIAAGQPVEGVTPEAIRQAIATAKADEKAALLLESYKEQAVRVLDDLEDVSLKGLLRRLVARIFNELSFSGFCHEAEHERTTGTTSSAGDSQ